MSRERVELIRQGSEAFETGDMDPVFDLMADDLVTFRSDPDGAVYHGKEGFLQAVAEWTEDFEDWSATAAEIIDAGDRVVVRNHQTARGKGSGVPVEADFWLVFSFSGLTVTRCDIYSDEGKALEAAGLAG
jgi:ketosteroid isomerase-like protein